MLGMRVQYPSRLVNYMTPVTRRYKARFAAWSHEIGGSTQEGETECLT